MTAHRGGEIEALRMLERELRAEQPPDLDWDRVEQRVLERARDDDEPPRLPQRSYFWPAAGALAAAAALALATLSFVRSGTQPVSELAAPDPLPLAAPATPGVIDGERVALGATIEAHQASVRIDHPGRASWSLEPGARARIVERGDAITVALDAGSLLARVTPSARAESFAVEIEQARVAVRGTVFRVEHGSERARVEVTEGSVAVGPASTRGATRGFLLVAPASGSFAFDGKSGSVDEPARTLADSPRGAALPAAAPSQPAALERTRTSDLPDSPPMSAIEDGVSRMVDLANRCFAGHTQRRGDIQIVVATTLTFEAAPDGSVRGLGFAPPLAPAVHDCVQGGLSAIKFRPSFEGARITRTLELSP